MSNQGDFFILLLERYAEYKNKSGAEVLKMFHSHQLIDYIYGMYELYHIEDIRNAFEDLDEKIGW